LSSGPKGSAESEAFVISRKNLSYLVIINPVWEAVMRRIGLGIKKKER
jgi:hypothetical protein